MLNNHPYSVPEGYFDDLQSKLSEIPHLSECKVSRWQKVQPYLALVACFCFALALGQAIKKRTVGMSDTDDTLYEQLIYADMIPHSEPYSIFDTDRTLAAEDSPDENDVIAYLIETGTSIELIDYFSE